MSLVAPSPPNLTKYLEASTAQYEACLDCLTDRGSITGFDATLRYHHLRFDANGQPKFADLAEVLADHIIEYCFSARRRGSPRKPHEHARLAREGRAYLRKMTTSGEAGEMLLYLLLEAVLQAPQMVAKMELKTNPKLEGNGSDGIHMKWHDTDDVLDVYFGEAKLEQTIYAALDSMIESINKFHADGLQEHEFGLVTSHYKHACAKTRKAVLDYLDRKVPGKDCRINHACLVGYDWEKYKELQQTPANQIHAEFGKHYSADLPRIQKLISTRFVNFSHHHLRFEIFFLPFPTVQSFRDAFNAVV